MATTHLYTAAATKDAKFWDDITGTVAADTDAAYGPSSLKLTGVSGLASVRKSGAVGNSGRAVFAFKVINETGGLANEFCAIKTSDLTTVLLVGITDLGDIFITDLVGSKSVGATSTLGIHRRFVFTWTITSSTNWSAKLYLDDFSAATQTLILTAGNADFNLANTGPTVFELSAQNCDIYFTGLHVDDSSALTHPGDIRTTAKLPAALNTNNFDTAIGTSTNRWESVAERPLSEAKGWQHAAVTDVQENYGLESAAAGDLDISASTIIGRMAFIYAKRGASTNFCSWRAAISGSGNTTTGGTLVIPAGTATGDSLFVCVTSLGHTSGNALVTCTDDDSGGNTWTLVTNTTDRRAYLFWKRATSATASKTITIAGGITKTAFNCIVMQNAATSVTPYTNVSAFETNASGDETHETITPSIDGSAICFAVYQNGTAANATSTQSTANLGTMTERAEHLPAGAGNDTGQSIATLNGTDAAAAATGNITWAQTNGATYSIVWAVRPEALGGAPKIMDNGTETAITLTTSSALHTVLTTSASYPSNAAGIGMRSTGNSADTFLYECGMIVACLYVAPAAATRGTPFGHRGTAFNGGRALQGIIQ